MAISPRSATASCASISIVVIARSAATTQSRPAGAVGARLLPRGSSPRAAMTTFVEDRAMATIGFIGLGNMGAPMAANLVKAQHHVTGCDLVAAACAVLTGKGGHEAASAADAAAAGDIVITMLPAGPQVRA